MALFSPFDEIFATVITIKFIFMNNLYMHFQIASYGKNFATLCFIDIFQMHLHLNFVFLSVLIIYMMSLIGSYA